MAVADPATTPVMQADLLAILDKIQPMTSAQVEAIVTKAMADNMPAFQQAEAKINPYFIMAFYMLLTLGIGALYLIGKIDLAYLTLAVGIWIPTPSGAGK